MILWLAKLISGLTGGDSTAWQKRLLLIGFALIFAFVILGVTCGYQACNKPATLNEKQIQKGEQAKKDANDKALKQVLAESDARVETEIDAPILVVEEATRQAEKKYENWTREQAQAEFDRRAQASK